MTRKRKNHNYYQRFIDSLNSTDTGEVAENVTYIVNEDLIKEKSKYDGYYTLTPNLHFMTCFISLFIYRLLEKKLNYKYTTSQILDNLEQKRLRFVPQYERTNITYDLHDIFNFYTDLKIVILNIKN